VPVEGWDDVAVDVGGDGGDGGGGVSEAFGDDLERYTGLEGEGGPGVAEVVEADLGESVAGDAAVELAGEPLGVVGLACGQAEDEVAWGVAVSDGETFGGLRCAPASQGGDGAGVELEASGLVGLGVALDVDAVSDGGGGLAELDPSGVESRSCQRSPSASPRRTPVVARKRKAGP
jgi:hypothetical protein